MFDATALEEALQLLGQLLADRNQPFNLVAIGGGGLLLIGLIERPTKDVDLVALRDGATLLPVTTLAPPSARRSKTSRASSTCRRAG